MKNQKIEQSILKNKIYPETIKIQDLPEKGKFDNFKICKETQQNLQKKNIEFLLPIQIHTFNHIFQKKDLITLETKGKGKILSFALPLLELYRSKKYFKQKQNQKVLILIITSTRERARKITKEFLNLKQNEEKFKIMTLSNQENYEFQKISLLQGVEIVVGTPERVYELVRDRYLKLNRIRTVILDEADLIIDMGFYNKIEQIINFAPVDFIQNCQLLIFSEQMPSQLQKIALHYMNENFIFIDLLNLQNVDSEISHFFIKFYSEQEKKENLESIIKAYNKNKKTIIYSDLETQAKQITEPLRKLNVYSNFDVSKEKFQLIIQFSSAKNLSTYINRIKTVDCESVCISFVQYDALNQLCQIERLINIQIKEIKLKEILNNSEQSKLVKEILKQNPDKEANLIFENLKNQSSTEECLKKCLVLLKQLYNGLNSSSTNKISQPDQKQQQELIKKSRWGKGPKKEHKKWSTSDGEALPLSQGNYSESKKPSWNKSSKKTRKLTSFDDKDKFQRPHDNYQLQKKTWHKNYPKQSNSQYQSPEKNNYQKNRNFTQNQNYRNSNNRNNYQNQNHRRYDQNSHNKNFMQSPRNNKQNNNNLNWNNRNRDNIQDDKKKVFVGSIPLNKSQEDVTNFLLDNQIKVKSFYFITSYQNYRNGFAILETIEEAENLKKQNLVFENSTLLFKTPKARKIKNQISQNKNNLQLSIWQIIKNSIFFQLRIQQRIF